MPTDRRDFLRLTAAATGGLGLGVSPESLVADSFRNLSHLPEELSAFSYSEVPALLVLIRCAMH